MRVHPAASEPGIVDPTPARYTIRIHGHLGATLLSAFPALVPQWHGADTVLTGLLDRSALYGVLAEIEALGLDLLEVRQHTAPEITRTRRQPLTLMATTVRHNRSFGYGPALPPVRRLRCHPRLGAGCSGAPASQRSSTNSTTHDPEHSGAAVQALIEDSNGLPRRCHRHS